MKIIIRITETANVILVMLFLSLKCRLSEIASYVAETVMLENTA